jgi:hypothetical protein
MRRKVFFVIQGGQDNGIGLHDIAIDFDQVQAPWVDEGEVRGTYNSVKYSMAITQGLLDHSI